MSLLVKSLSGSLTTVKYIFLLTKKFLNIVHLVYAGPHDLLGVTMSGGQDIVKILNLYIILLCAHLYHTSFRYLFSYLSIWIESKPIVWDSSCSITDNSD